MRIHHLSSPYKGGTDSERMIFDVAFTGSRVFLAFGLETSSWRTAAVEVRLL